MPLRASSLPSTAARLLLLPKKLSVQMSHYLNSISNSVVRGKLYFVPSIPILFKKLR